MNKIPKHIKEILYTKIQGRQSPYTYTLRGTSGGGFSTRYSAYTSLEKLKGWVESVGAELVIKDNGFKNVQKVTKARIVLEITDPASQLIDRYLKEVRKDSTTPPLDRVFFLKHVK